IQSANSTVMNITLMELNRNFKDPESDIEKMGRELVEDKNTQKRNRVAEETIKDIREMVREENQTGWVSKKDYQLIKEDKNLAVEVAAVIYMVGTPLEKLSRINHLDFFQSHSAGKMRQ